MLNGLDRPRTTNPGTMEAADERSAEKGLKPNIASKISVCLLCLVCCLFIPGFSAPYWISYSCAHDDGHYGLWKFCYELHGTLSGEKLCKDLTFIDLGDKRDWFKATEGLMITTLILLILATALLIYWLCSYSRYFCAKFFIVVFFFFSFGASVAGIIVFEVGLKALDTSSENVGFGWCFYLVKFVGSHTICRADPPESSLCDSKICSFVVGVSSGLLFFVPIPLFYIPSGRATRWNRSWPIVIEGPPSAPPQGNSKVELTYPNLAPSTKPERNADHMYPDSPPRYEDIKSCTHPNSSPFYEKVSNENPRSPPSAAAAEL